MTFPDHYSPRVSVGLRNAHPGVLDGHGPPSEVDQLSSVGHVQVEQRRLLELGRGISDAMRTQEQDLAHKAQHDVRLGSCSV